MLRLIQLEWLKFKGNRVFQVMMILFIICMAFVLLIGKEINEVPPPLPNNKVFFRFPSVWDYQGYIGNWLVFFFIGIFAVYMITSEYVNKTIRQNIITGLTRNQFFVAKFSFGLCLALFSTLIYVLTCLVYGVLHTPDFAFELIFEHFEMVPRFLLMSIGYVSFGLLMGLLFRKSGLSMFIYLSYAIFLEMIIRWGMHYQLFEHRSMLYYPLNAIEDLVPIPIGRLVQDTDLPFDIFLTPWQAVITSSIYIVLFIYLSYRMIKKGNL